MICASCLVLSVHACWYFVHSCVTFRVLYIAFLAIGCWRFTKFCWVGKHINITMKPTSSPTQGQRNPRKNRLKSGVWATLSHSKYFFVGWDLFYIGNRLQETPPNQILHKHPYILCTVNFVCFVGYPGPDRMPGTGCVLV